MRIFTWALVVFCLLAGYESTATRAEGRWKVFAIWMLAMAGFFVVALTQGCTCPVESCERVRDAVNGRLVACSIPEVLRLDCESADYHDGDVDACIAAIHAAPCGQVEQTYFDMCELFGQVP